MAVATDNELRLANGGAFDNWIIVWIGGNDFQSARDRDHFGEGANFVCDLGCSRGVQTALELEFLGKFSQNRFARDGQALAVAGRLDALMRVPQPPD